MICRYGKRFLLFSVLFWVLLSPLYSDVVLTDGEYQELETIFARWATLSDEQAIAIATLQARLEIADYSLMNSQAEMQKAVDSLDALRISYERQRLAHVGNLVLTALISAAVGIIAGLIIGT